LSSIIKQHQTVVLPACRICAGTTTAHLNVVRGCRLVHCHSCGFVQVADMPSAEALRAIYQEAYFGHSKYRDEATLRSENQRRLKLLRTYVAPGASILEAGCGDGSFLQLAQQHYSVYGCDLSPAGIALAQTKSSALSQRLWVSRLEAPALSNFQVDAICLWDVLEHVWDPLNVLRSLLHYLKPGGSLLISTPNIGAPIARLMGSRWAFMTPPEHLSFFARRSMQQLVEQQLGRRIVHWRSLGKRANLGFIAYKARRVIPAIPAGVPKLFAHPLLAGIAVYVPTGDIQYVCIQ
jgi:2-polyprenyl-3-methyl-5-hydroxy-6-metoxy-1,4-benzoquinol methylase